MFSSLWSHINDLIKVHVAELNLGIWNFLAVFLRYLYDR